MGIPIAGLRGFIAGAAEHGKPVNLIWTETQSA
jgi:hypothetical protein